MKLTRPGDVVWGTGLNGKSMSVGAAPHLDIRAVRGPLTREALCRVGATVPEVFGDPGLLWASLWPREAYLSGTSPSGPAVVQNMHDHPMDVDSARVISPIGQPHDVIAQIARSEFVCGSSLHGIVIAESFGIPARLVLPQREPLFKYRDYYEGTGRADPRPAESVAEALRLGGERAPVWNPQELLGSFPYDLWRDSPRLERA
ncbi:polysaccharide pyruvyl transferase family protein [Microbacterium sp.]|uniref:polysaccharide pyruvyl transferase family protein n=1 Tax=Microbacterium sp. TaxID=51671 RepID=UPI003A8652E6